MFLSMQFCFKFIDKQKIMVFMEKTRFISLYTFLVSMGLCEGLKYFNQIRPLRVDEISLRLWFHHLDSQNTIFYRWLKSISLVITLDVISEEEWAKQCTVYGFEHKENDCSLLSFLRAFAHSVCCTMDDDSWSNKILFSVSLFAKAEHS